MARETRTNTLSRLIRAALLVAIGLGALFLVLPGCDSTPAEPEYDNPFDPLGPDAGDPLTDKPNTIVIWWNQPQDLGITKYEISHSDNPDSNWEFLAVKEATSDRLTFHDYPDPVATMTHWFRIQAKDDLGRFSITSFATPGSVTIGPWVRMGATFGKIASRYPRVAIAVTSGDSIRIALDANYTDSLRVIPVHAPGDTAYLDYDLGPASGNGDTIRIYVQSFTGPQNSFTTLTPAQINFRPNFQIVGTPTTVGTRSIDLFVPSEGVLQMRFANSESDLAAEPWVAVADTFFGFLLTDSANRQAVWGEFQGDFGFTSDVIPLVVQPDLLDTATFSLLPGGGSISQSRMVAIQADAVATQMRMAETPNFAGVPWRPYAPIDSLMLSEGEGLKVVYGQFRNDWLESDILTDTVVYVSQPAEIRFLAPLDGDLVIGSRTLEVRGISAAGSGAASVDSVKFDGGDGLGFRVVTGTDEWSYLWDAPPYIADTDVVLRARAYVGTDSVTAAITVTVTQLAVVIDDPLEGDQLLGDTEVTITGRAASVLGGAPIDSVVVDIGGGVDPMHLVADGTNTWSTTWTTQTVTAILNATITARAWAAGEVVSDDISVTVAPQ